jgi:hypothetical protein
MGPRIAYAVQTQVNQALSDKIPHWGLNLVCDRKPGVTFLLTVLTTSSTSHRPSARKVSGQVALSTLPMRATWQVR